MERMIKLCVMIIAVDYILSNTGLRIWRITGKFNPVIFFFSFLFFFIDTIFIEFRNFEKSRIETLNGKIYPSRNRSIGSFKSFNPFFLSLLFLLSTFLLSPRCFLFFSSVENCVLDLYTRCVQDNWTSFQVPRAVGYKTSTFLDRDEFDTKVLDFVRSTITGIIFVHERRNLLSNSSFFFLKYASFPPFVHNIDNSKPRNNKRCPISL